MSSTRHPRLRSIVAGTTGALLIAALGLPGLTYAADTTESTGQAAALPAQRLDGALRLDPKLAQLTGDVTVYVQLKGQGAYFASQSPQVLKGLSAPENRENEAKPVQDAIRKTGTDLAASVGAEPIYTTVNTVPGVAIRVNASKLKELAANPDVVSIAQITPQERNTKGADLDVKALDSWVNNGDTGEGVTIAVLDTGLDYTHADFGGPGTPEAYQQAKKSGEVKTLAQIPSQFYDAKKFVGGHDLAGDAYNADSSAASFNPTPRPDGNPLDCTAAGHGSHVAGIAAGYGVDKDGKTFKGDYGTLDKDQEISMNIGPGTAPKARLASFRVFGCEGSTDLTGQALDEVLDPQYYRDPAQMAKVVNLSLGSSYGVDNSAELPIVQALQKAGVLLVISAGNEGDIYNVLGSPGAYKSALTVANSLGSYQTQVYDQAKVSAPENLAGTANGQRSANFDFGAATPEQLVSPKVVTVPADNAFGCQPFAPGTFKDGAWVWLQWSEDGAFPCGSAVRFNNVEAAGAKGVILDSEVNVFDAGIAGNATIPGFQLTADDSAKYRAAAQSGELRVDLNVDTHGSLFSPTDKLDVLSDSSSRGGHGSDGSIKPDIAAPGTSIGSVAVGTGNGLASMSGTSMAAPDIAGLAALVYSHTGGIADPAVVKSKLMNTSSNTLKNSDGSPAGPSRAGTGRADVLSALNTPVYASATEDPVGTSVVFGVVEAKDQPVTETKSITLHNESDAPVTYAVGVTPSTEVPGATFAVGSSQVSVPAKGTAQVDVLFQIADPAKLAKSITQGTARVESDIARQYVAEAQARVSFTAQGKPTLNVVAQAAPKPVSELDAGKTIEYPEGVDSIPLQFAGRGVDQGSGDEHYQSLVSPFTLGYTAQEEPGKDTSEVVKGAIVKEAGVNTDFGQATDDQGSGASQPEAGPTGTASPTASPSASASAAPTPSASPEPPTDPLLNFGIATFGQLAVLDNANFEVDIDTNGDQKADFAVVNARLNNVDLNVAATYDLRGDSPQQVPGSLLPINTQTGEVDTNNFDSNVFTLPTNFSSLGLTAAQSAFSYKVVTSSSYVSTEEGTDPTQLTETDWIAYDPAHPGVKFSGKGDGLIFTADSSAPLDVTRGAKDAKALLLFHQNVSGTRDQVVTLADEKTEEPTPAPSDTPSAGPTTSAPASPDPAGTDKPAPSSSGQPTQPGQPSAGSPGDGPVSTPATAGSVPGGSMPDTGAHTGIWLGALALVLIGGILIGLRFVLKKGKHNS